MAKPLGKSEFTKIYNNYAKRFNIAEQVGQPQISGNQELAAANPQTGQPPQPANTPEMKEFTDALAKLGQAIGKFKDPKMIENANAELQKMLAKKPGQATTPVTPASNPAQPQSPANQPGNNLSPQGQG